MKAIEVLTEVMQPRSFARFEDGSYRWLAILTSSDRTYRVLSDGPDTRWVERGRELGAIAPVSLQSIAVDVLNKDLTAA